MGNAIWIFIGIAIIQAIVGGIADMLFKIWVIYMLLRFVQLQKEVNGLKEEVSKLKDNVSKTT